MDLNYLFHRHQISLAAATRAACGPSRASHRGLVAGYAARIADHRAATGARLLLAERVS